MQFLLFLLFGGGVYLLSMEQAQAAFNADYGVGPPQPASIPNVTFSVDNGGFNIGFDSTQTDIDTLARTAWGEDRAGGARGMQAVMNCIMNRYNAAQETTAYQQLFGDTVADICKKPAQFSCWNVSDPNFGALTAVDNTDPQFATALQLADQAINGNLPDLTGGALYYRGYGAKIPSNAVLTATIGGNKFFNYA